MTIASHIVFQFQENAELQDWYIVNDGVMGGVSTSSIKVTDEGYGLFSGQVSTANYGGFASVRYQPQELSIHQHTHLLLRVKGAPTTYQLRVSNRSLGRQSYMHTFETTGEWQEVKIALADMRPVWRGRSLSMPHFQADSIDEITILIGNKRNESFELLIDYLSLSKD